MCCQNCCSSKNPLALRLQLKKQKELEEEAARNKLKPIVVTPQTLLYDYQDIQAMADFIMANCKLRPKFGIICAAILSSFVTLIENPVVIPYESIPKFPVTTVEGHEGKLVVGTLMGATVMVMQGRFHLYEGYQLANCTVAVRVMKLCGVKDLFITSAAGGVNLKYALGDIVLIKDHINLIGLLGLSPLTGPNDARFGIRNPSMVNAYDRQLIEKGLEIGRDLGYEDCMHTGVFGCLGGPVYETEAEDHTLRLLGVDAVGMSLVHEVIVARHCGLRVFSIGIITVPPYNPDSPERDQSQNPFAFQRSQQACSALITRLIYYIQNEL